MQIYLESRDGTVVRGLTYHKCPQVQFWPGVMRGLSLLLVFALLQGFVSGLSRFPPSTKTNISKFHSLNRDYFSKDLETFWACKAIAKSRTSRLPSCFIQIFLIWTEVAFIQEVSVSLVYSHLFKNSTDRIKRLKVKKMNKG